MKLSYSFFDSNVLLGPLRRQPAAAPRDVPGLLTALDGHGIDKALVTHTYAKWHEPASGNARLMQEIAGQPRLEPCWVVLPAATGEVGPEAEQVDQLLAAGVRVARLCAAAHRLSLEPWEIEPLVAALAARRVPLLLDFDLNHWSETKPQRYRFAHWAGREYPDMPLVLLREPGTELRTLLPLLDVCPNLFIETSYMQAHHGIRLLVERYGAQRLLFGTGLPVWDPGLPITGLTYAGLAPADLATVAGGALRRLMEGCVR